MQHISMGAIGHVRSTRTRMRDDDWDRELSRVELDATQFTGDALAGLDEFSHAEIVFYMDRVAPDKIETAARHPRNNRDWPKIGIFAQRGKNRPNRIGTTVCRITAVEGLTVFLEGLDAIDGTPVLDIKPWIVEFAPRGEIRQPTWVSELMCGYWTPQ